MKIKFKWINYTKCLLIFRVFNFSTWCRNDLFCQKTSYCQNIQPKNAQTILKLLKISAILYRKLKAVSMKLASHCRQTGWWKTWQRNMWARQLLVGCFLYCRLAVVSDANSGCICWAMQPDAACCEYITTVWDGRLQWLMLPGNGLHTYQPPHSGSGAVTVKKAGFVSRMHSMHSIRRLCLRSCAFDSRRDWLHLIIPALLLKIFFLLLLSEGLKNP